MKYSKAQSREMNMTAKAGHVVVVAIKNLLVR